MNNLKLTTILALSLIVAPASAAVQDCEYAISSYDNAVRDIETRLQRYARCIQWSQGQDDCSSEFRRLRSAQSGFETAVSSYRFCRND